MALIEFKDYPNTETPLTSENLNYNFNEILNLMWPIGRGFIDFTNTDYSHWLGFTWERELIGMVGVGIDTTQTEFNIIGKTGGSKFLQKHSHKTGIQPDTFGGLYADDGNRTAKVFWSSNGIATSDTGTGESGNLQPYKVVAYWKRIK